MLEQAGTWYYNWSRAGLDMDADRMLAGCWQYGALVGALVCELMGTVRQYSISVVWGSTSTPLRCRRSLLALLRGEARRGRGCGVHGALERPRRWGGKDR